MKIKTISCLNNIQEIVLEPGGNGGSIDISKRIIEFSHPLLSSGGKLTLDIEYKVKLPTNRPDGTIGTVEDKDNDIKISKYLELLTLSCDNKVGKKIENINIEKTCKEKSFSIKFNKNAITDCYIYNINCFFIFYTIQVLVDGRNANHDIKDYIKVNLNRPECHPEISLNRDEILFNNGKTNNGKTETKLILKNSQTIRYSPTLNVKPTKIYLKKGQDEIQDIGEIDFPNQKPAGKNKGYVPKGVRIGEDNQPPKDYVQRLYACPGYWVEVPISLDLSKISNPIEEEALWNLVIEYEYWSNIDPINKTGSNCIILKVKRNDELNDLRVELQDNNGRVDKISEGIFKATKQPIPINFRTQQGDGFTNTFKIVIKNSATIRQTLTPDAGVVIKNFNLGPLTFDNIAITAYNGNNMVSTEDFIDRKINFANESNGEIRLRPGEETVIEITIITGQIDGFRIGADQIFTTELCQEIEFDYFIDNCKAENTNPEHKHWQGKVVFDMEIPPSSDWMAVDFGTSAVVALYGDAEINMRQGNRLQNLATIKKQLLRAAYKNQPEFAVTTDEEEFINSNIELSVSQGSLTEGFYVKPKKNETNYTEGLVLFSPGDQMHYDKVLPPLKSMMGHPRIPNGKHSVEDVYKTVYHQLFDLYLTKINNNEKIEKIVLTYPNTFASSHVAQLRKIAKECMPNLRDGYIYTISESDAIAYRYLFLRAREERNPARDFMSKNILIYDMGAGTLDLTYFTCQTKKDTNIFEVDIKGKFGINKAGNYLDYILAEIVVEKCKVLGKNTISGGINIDDFISLDPEKNTEIASKFELKKYVKNVLKPVMAAIDDPSKLNDDKKMPPWNNYVEELKTIPLREVFDNTKFKTFVEDVSEKVIKKCNENWGCPGIGVVVFSGRMTQFKCIRKAVEGKLKLLHSIIDISDGRWGNALKSCVAEGALNYVENFLESDRYIIRPPKLFYCYYCVVVSHLSGFQVHCFLDNNNNSIGENINMNGVRKIYLVQTYAKNKQEILDDLQRDGDFSTIISELKVDTFRGEHRVTIKVDNGEIDANMQGTRAVRLLIDQQEINLLPQDNLNSTSFKKSSWPVIF